MARDLVSTTEFLANEVYLPGYMAVRAEDYDGKGGIFTFDVKEPPVARGSIVNYLTPRGLHICISQGGYALVENMAREGKFEDFDITDMREFALDGRWKITELNQKFKKEIEIAYLRNTLLEGRVKMRDLYQKFGREVGLRRPIQGRFNITKFRPGRMPVLKLDFDFENGAITGNTTSVIAPKPVPQTNIDIVRN